ncbi:DinB family protein [Vreelandella boliviensis]|uniref:Protein dinB n=1 Tax=Vreelandella boliviensis LC1 TaxID=1072583 RepID=A0A265DVT2_9GAMM|nr:DinB family protein [Halomonas boliviensis]EHJ92159.1 Protein dinB [Halomonas boliviensis LC1]OZT73432.1 damage-inducible protein DinB [Halomonas boliviensis LC1]
MELQPHFELMASYNQWMNTKVYDVASKLTTAELSEERGAFFSSIFGTLNHLVVADTIWLKRFAMHPSSTARTLAVMIDLPMPQRLDQVMFDDLEGLKAHRRWLDTVIINWVGALTDDDLSTTLSYHNTKGVASKRCFSSLIFHFFNHQTHHRGQISTLFSQAGVDIGVTDLLALIPDEMEI